MIYQKIIVNIFEKIVKWMQIYFNFSTKFNLNSNYSLI